MTPGIRKALLFLGVFALGLAVLWLLRSPGGERGVGRPAAEPGAESVPEVHPLVDPGGQDRAPVRLSGAQRADLYAPGEGPSRPRLHHLESRNFVAEDASFRRYRAEGLSIESFDPATNELKRTIRAARGRFGIAGERLRDLALADEGRVLLEQVTVTLHSGHPLAPLTIVAPVLEGYLDRDELRSVGEGIVTVAGEGLVGSGRGLVVDGTAGTLALERGGELAFERGAQGLLRFSSPAGGPLTLERLGAEGARTFVAWAEDGSRLVSEGDPPTQVDARTIRLFGSRGQGGEVVWSRAEAEGEVLATRGRERYRGESAEIVLDEGGQLERVVLEEQVSAELVLLDAAGRELPIEALGAGPLTVVLPGGEARFELLGPCQVRAPSRDLTIEAQGRLQGMTNEARTSATLAARDRVRVTQGVSELETEALDALLIAGEQQATQLFASGVTQLVRRQAGELLVVDVEEEVEVQIRGRHWTVPLARGVRVRSEGPRPYRASAGEVRDLDLEARVFVAEGSASWEGVFGRGSAQHVEVGEDGVAHLLGTAGTPARFHVLSAPAPAPDEPKPEPASRYRAATVAALAIDVAETWLEARGAVDGELEALDGSYALDADYARLDRELPDVLGAPASFELEARGVRRITVLDAAAATVTDASAQRVHVSGMLAASEGRGEPQAREVKASELEAVGQVRVDHVGQVEVHGQGERLTLDPDGLARLDPAQGERVHVWGPLPEGGPPYELWADHFEWDRARLAAVRPHMVIESPLLGVAQARVLVPAAQIEAADFVLDQGGLRFVGDVLMQGSDAQGVPITVRAGGLRLSGDFGEDFEPADWRGALEALEIWGGFSAVYGGLGYMRGERMQASRERARIWGSGERRASVQSAGLRFESSYLELDLVRFLVSSERGALSGDGWRMEFASLEPREEGGETFFVLVSPHFMAGTQEARGDFATAWIHADAWRSTGHELLWGAPLDLEQPPAPVRPTPELPERDLVENVFRKLLAGELGRYLRAAYLEGHVEVTEQGRTSATAQSVYLDMERRFGWLREVRLNAHMGFGSGGEQRMRVATDMLRTAADGSLRAEKATLTTSKLDVPSYVIETGELVLAPRAERGWRFAARKNRFRFSNGIALPLPSLGSIVLDDDGGFLGFEDEEGDLRTIENVRIGNEARFGTTFGTAFRSDIGRLGRKLGRLLGFDPDKIRGKWYTEASYLGDRGILGGLGLELSERDPESGHDEQFWFNVYGQGIDDDGEDRGLVRVDEDERSGFRRWIHGRGRYPFSDYEWIDVVFSTQSDPGVQAEFYQSEFQRYEERDNYLHYRRVDGARYLDGSLKLRSDDFRTEVEERPAAGAYWGERKVGSLGGLPLLYGSNLDLDYLRRREGDLRFERPFVDVFGDPDGLGDREVLRIDSSQRLSLPFQTGVGGIRTVPWLEGRFTAWDEGIDEDDDPTRAALIAGVDLATVLHKPPASGFIHTLTPTLGYRSDLAVEEHGGLPVRFDGTEDPLDGQEVHVGLRALWWKPGQVEHLDLEVKVLRRWDRAGGLDDQGQVAALGQLRTMIGNMPFALLHDGRYDFENSGTLYSRSTLALRPSQDLEFQTSYLRGADNDLRGLFETASFAARYRLDPKWEVELAQTISIKGGGSLLNRVLLRRFGPDFMLELEVDHRAGEGGTTVAINFLPLFAWKSRPLGILGR